MSRASTVSYSTPLSLTYDTAEFITDMVFSEVFTTEAMQYADINISVEWSDYWDGEALFNYGYSQFEGCDNEAILPVSVNIEGDYDEYYYAIYSRDLTDEQTLPDEMFYDDLSQGLNRIGGGQTLITCCEDEGISSRTGGKVLFVEKGKIR